jgi:hypothetical protein
MKPEHREFSPQEVELLTEPVLLLCPRAFRDTGAVKQAEEQGIHMTQIGVCDHLINEPEESEQLSNPKASLRTLTGLHAEEPPEENFSKHLHLFHHLTGGKPPQTPHAAIQIGHLMEEGLHLITPRSNRGPKHLHNGGQEPIAQFFKDGILPAARSGTELGTPAIRDRRGLLLKPA